MSSFISSTEHYCRRARQTLTISTQIDDPSRFRQRRPKIRPPISLEVRQTGSQTRRGFAIRTQETFWPLYLALVRPILEYGLQASSHYPRRDLDLMKRLQRLATIRVKSLRGLSYEERLRRVILFTIERRLLRGDLILVDNPFKGRLNVPLDELIPPCINRKKPTEA